MSVALALDHAIVVGRDSITSSMSGSCEGVDWSRGLSEQSDGNGGRSKKGVENGHFLDEYLDCVEDY